MRKARGPLWWYELRYGIAPWNWAALAIVFLLVCSRAGQMYEWSRTVPVCHKNADANAATQAPQIGPTEGGWQPRITRCREGWTDLRVHTDH